MLIGLDIDDAQVVAVRLNDRGDVEARATVTASGDHGAAVRSALEQVKAGSGDSAIGVAAVAPHAACVAASVAALRDSGYPHAQQVVPAGTAAVVAECWAGAAKGAQDAVFLSAAGHTCAGILRRGAPFDGARGRAASAAWLALNPVDREDYRKVGCLETEVSSAGIVRRLVWRVKTGDHSSVQDAVGGDTAAITVDHVLNAARQGDGVAISIVRDTAKYLGMAAANLVVIVDPEVLVLGGIMASAADILMKPLRAEIARRLPRVMLDSLAIVPAALGHEAAAIGAARLASGAPR